jgi:hypothetical protein
MIEDVQLDYIFHRDDRAALQPQPYPDRFTCAYYKQWRALSSSVQHPLFPTGIVR